MIADHNPSSLYELMTSVLWDPKKRKRYIRENMGGKQDFSEPWDDLIVRKELSATTGYLMKEPYLGKMLKGTIQRLQENIPQMITFAESDIDLQPWERWAKASYISDSETEIALMPLVRDMMGQASIPGLFGRALLDKYPNILHDVYDMDSGFIYFLMGLPQWTPWPSVNRAHRARRRIWQALDDQQRTLDAAASGKHVDLTWGDLDDVSDLIWKRNEIFRSKHVRPLNFEMF